MDFLIGLGVLGFSTRVNIHQEIFLKTLPEALSAPEERKREWSEWRSTNAFHVKKGLGHTEDLTEDRLRSGPGYVQRWPPGRSAPRIIQFSPCILGNNME